MVTHQHFANVAFSTRWLGNLFEHVPGATSTLVMVVQDEIARGQLDTRTQGEVHGHRIGAGVLDDHLPVAGDPPKDRVGSALTLADFSWCSAVHGPRDDREGSPNRNLRMSISAPDGSNISSSTFPEPPAPWSW